MGIKLNFKYVSDYVNNNTTAKLRSTEYINSTSKLAFECECGDLFERTWSKFKHSNRHTCFKCSKNREMESKRISEKEILNHFKGIKSTFIGKYISERKTCLNIKCSCGEEYSQDFQNFKGSPNKVCKSCSDKLKGFIKRTSKKDINEELDSYNLVMLSEYVGIDVESTFLCVCGELFQSTVWKIRASKNKVCYRCSNKIRGDFFKKDKASFIKTLARTRPYIELVGKFDGMNTKTEFRFKDCEHINIRRPRDILKHKNTQCTVCKASRGESKIESFLISNNIEYIKQKTFDECFNLSKLRFDFYLPKYNTCIEFQGEFHFERERLKKGDSVFGGFKEFLVSKKRDLIKKKFCRISKVNLLEIMYYESDNINKILKYLFKI